MPYSPPCDPNSDRPRLPSEDPVRELIRLLAGRVVRRLRQQQVTGAAESPRTAAGTQSPPEGR